MNADRWRRVQALCDELDTVTIPEARVRLDALEADANVRQEALALLEAMREEAEAQQQWGAREAEPQQLPQVIAGVRILERLGSGGSGEVFRGIRRVNETEQSVAIKCFYAHRARPEHLERFAREQRMLATLTHPDIVRFLDAGVAGDGRPYLVMELVDGQPLTEYCDRGRLRLSERLRLMISVCHAVQSAHRLLIVHLDLKPSNILVSRDGHVKLLDFGAAKLVDPAAHLTRTEPLTLQYASPERLRGEPVSVACDIYSLGLLLYELVSGGWPFAHRESMLSVAERAGGHLEVLPMARRVTDTAAHDRAVSRARLRASLSGDLEAICAKALSHAPNDRYVAVSELADDLRRHLDGEPVRARPIGPGQRLAKFVRRHAWAAAAAATLVIGLTAAAVYSAGQARLARRAEARAVTQNRFLTSVFTLAGTDAASRAGMTVRELLSLAQARVTPSLGSNPAIAADVDVILARGFISQNAFDEARAVLDRSIARATASGDVAREAVARAELAYVLYVQSQNESSAAEATTALALWTEHSDRFTPEQVVAATSWSASTLSYLNPLDRSPMPAFEACVATSRRLADTAQLDRATCLVGLGILYMNLESRYVEADALLREAIAIQRADPSATEALSLSLQMLGLVNRYRGRFDEDERAQHEAMQITERLQPSDSRAAVWYRAVWVASLTGVDRVDEAYAESKRVLAAARRFYPARGSYLLWTPLFSAASAACMSHRANECEALAAEAIESLGPSPSADDPRLHAARGFLGLAFSATGRHAEARPLLEGALAMNTARKRTPPYTPLLEAALAAASK